MGSLLKMTLLQLTLLFLCSAVLAVPNPRKPESGSTTTENPKDSNVTPKVSNVTRKARSTNALTSSVKCYQDCSTSCDNEQCHKQCIDQCNSDPENGKQPDTISAVVNCYQNCGSSCSDAKCYEQCIADCNGTPDDGKLPDNVATALDCYEACGANSNNDEYEHCIDACNEDSGSETDEELPDFVPPLNGTDAGRCRLVCKFKCNPHHDEPPHPEPPHPEPPHPAPPHPEPPHPEPPHPHRQHHPFPGHIPPHCNVRCKTNCYRSSALSSSFARQSDVGKDCESTVIFTCDANGENCVAGDSSYDCEDDNSGDRDYPYQAPCPGVCQKRSVDGRCLKDTSCCSRIFRGGPHFVRCLIEN